MFVILHIFSMWYFIFSSKKQLLQTKLDVLKTKDSEITNNKKKHRKELAEENGKIGGFHYT